MERHERDLDLIAVILDDCETAAISDVPQLQAVLSAYRDAH